MKDLILALTCLFLIAPSQARIITVDDDGPADFNNIQAAINDANNGDEIVLQLGMYTGNGNRDIDFLGKAVTVRSINPNDPCTTAGTVINCQASAIDNHRGFVFQNSEEANSVLAGVTVTGGYMDGAIWLEHSGGGILCYQASPTLDNCLISDNYAREGGGIYTFDSTSVINYCEAKYNNHSGLRCRDSALHISNCTFLENSDSGIYLEDDTGAISNCVFIGNDADIGGGIRGLVNNASITNCEFIANESWGTDYSISGGGGAWLRGDCVIRNCLFVGNTAIQHGGGVVADGCGGDSVSTKMINCTFYNNQAGGGAGAVACKGGGSNNPLVKQCILWGNEPNDDPGFNVYPYDKCGLPHIHVSLSILQDNWADIPYSTVEDCCVADPCFADAAGGDYHLQSQAGRWDPNTESWVTDANTSVAIDAGDMADPVGLEPFPNGGIINMGVYGGTAEASKSYFGSPVCETIVAGDINGDCKVDFLDFALMAFHWLESNN